MNKVPDTLDLKYELTGNGMIAGLLSRFRLDQQRVLLVFLVLGLTWLPLFVLNAIDGTLYAGSGRPFLRDIAIQGRILLGISLLILIRPMVFKRVPRVLKYISEVLVAPEDVEKYQSIALSRAKRNMDSVLSEIVILALVIGIAANPSADENFLVSKLESGSWMIAHHEGRDVLSLAGNYAQYVSKPVFQFLLLRWLWRYIVWIIFLFRVSRLRLNLNATHPDGSGGIGIVYIGHRNFILFFMVCGVAISSMMISLMMENKSMFESIRIDIAGFVILSILLVCFPFLFFVGKLVDLKYDGQFKLSQTGVDLSRRFEDEWSKLIREEKRIVADSADSSMQNDYSSVFKLVQNFRVIPIRMSDITSMMMILFSPFLPILFIRYPIAELVERLVGLLV